MTRIELPEDYAQPARVTTGLTLLRIAIGGILIAHGTQHLLGLDSWQDELAVEFGLLEPHIVAQTLVGLELVGGVGLVFGWFTRLSGLALMCSVGISIAVALVGQSDAWVIEAFELPLVLSAAALFFMLNGGGPVSLDEWLRARARRRAIQNDYTWLRHPYVPRSDDPSYEESPSAGYAGYGPQSHDTSEERLLQQEHEDSMNPRLATTRR